MSTQYDTGLGLKKTAITDTVSQMVSDLSHNMDILNAIYPVGAIYMSTKSDNPSAFLGGSWKRISGRFPVGIDDVTFNAGQPGGRYDMGILPTANVPDGTANDKNAGLVPLGNSAVPSIYGGRAVVVSQGYTGKMLPPYYPVYMWERVE